MKVVLVMVQSINGKITRGKDPDIYTWTSKEDADFFFSLLKKSSLIVMGSGTYKAVKERMKPAPGQLRVILTASPEKYKKSEITGQIEFRDDSPENLVVEMKKKGHESLLLVGGGHVNKAFLEKHLVDELFITIEPKLFGSGTPLVAEGDYEVSLRLISSETLNGNGTILLHYQVQH